MKVKICGITNKDDAIWAINYGADMIGVNFFKGSPRHVSVASAGWVKELPGFSVTVGVFVDHPAADIVKTVQKLGLKGVQLHGAETPEAVAALRAALGEVGVSTRIIKAIRVRGAEDVAALAPYADVIDLFLLDAFVEGLEGGTGASFDWSLAAGIREFGKPFFLAGGLTPDNVRAAIKTASPDGVDVASGVEKSVRRKDPERIKQFITVAKER